MYNIYFLYIGRWWIIYVTVFSTGFAVIIAITVTLIKQECKQEKER